MFGKNGFSANFITIYIRFLRMESVEANFFWLKLLYTKIYRLLSPRMDSFLMFEGALPNRVKSRCELLLAYIIMF